jgi:hypothetical protein
MTHSTRPTVDELCARMKAELRRSRCPSAPPGDRLDDVATLLRAAAERSKPVTELPPQLNRFPFTRVALLRRLALKLLNFLTHDQRAVNATLVQALGELAAVQRAALSPELRLAPPEPGDVRRCAS